MIPSLLELSIKRVAECIVSGTFKNEDFRIADEQISNKIFKYINQDLKSVFSSETVDDITEKLNVSKIEINQYNDTLQSLIFSQNLKELTLGEHFEAGNNEKNIVVILKKFLNIKSLRKLRKLSIEGYDLDQTKQLSDIIPSITSLSLPYCNFYVTESYNFYDSFKKLKQLDLSNTGLNDLNGISKLKNLEVLIFNGNSISSREDIEGIFKLKKLKVLDLGFGADEYGLEKNLKHFLACEKGLPELKFLDCAHNDLDMEDLEKLVTLCPKLEMIGLIGTPLERTAQLSIPYRNLKLLTIDNLQNSLDSLNHYTRFSTSSTEILDFLIEGIEDKVISIPETLDDDDIRKCFDSIIYILSRTESGDFLSTRSVHILEGLVSCKPTIWTIPDCQQIIKAVLKAFSFFELKDDSETDNYEVQYAGWSILTNNAIREKSTGWTDKLCEVAVRLIENFDNVESPLFSMVLTYLEGSLKKMTPTRSFSLAQSHVAVLISKRMMTSAEGGGQDLIQIFLNILHSFLEIAHRFSLHPPALYRHRNYVELIFKVIEKFNHDPIVQNIILDSASDALKFLNTTTYDKFFEGMLERTILRLLNVQATHSSCVSFLVTLMQLQQNGITNEIRHDRLVQQILDKTSNFEFRNGSDNFRIVRHVKQSKSTEAEYWAQWVLRFFNAPEEPISKRARIH